MGLAKREMRSTRAVASLVLLAHRDEREEQKQGTTEAGDCRTGCSGGRGAGTCQSSGGWDGRIVPWGTGSGGWWSSMGGDSAAWCREEMALPANAMRDRDREREKEGDEAAGETGRSKDGLRAGCSGVRHAPWNRSTTKGSNREAAWSFRQR